MRARAAYISSLGTTTILVASALLLLAVVSAIVAFRGWPGGANGSSVQSVPLTRPAGDALTHVVRRVTHAHPAARTHRASHRAGRARLSTAGLVKGAPARRGHARAVPGLVMVPVTTVTMSSPTRTSAQQGAPGSAPSDRPDPSGGSLPIATVEQLVPDVPLPSDPTSSPSTEGVVNTVVDAVPPLPALPDTGISVPLP